MPRRMATEAMGKEEWLVRCVYRVTKELAECAAGSLAAGSSAFDPLTESFECSTVPILGNGLINGWMDGWMDTIDTLTRPTGPSMVAIRRNPLSRRQHERKIHVAIWTWPVHQNSLSRPRPIRVHSSGVGYYGVGSKKHTLE